ncbi:MAG: metallophosphoesterase [Puia sp.]|nr:metallophosphoesterase [Puia sp.]
MTLQYCSDLHLEFPENWKFLQKKPLTPVGEILVLAGDIMPFSARDSFGYFIDYLSSQFAAVYWTPGNHEYYGSDLTLRPSWLRVSPPGEKPSAGDKLSFSVNVFEAIRENVFLVNNREVLYKNTRLLFSTLWSPITPQHEWDIRRSVSDYRAIRVDGRNLIPADTNAMHEECRTFLATALKPVEALPASMPSLPASPDSSLPKTIVITHHVPTFLHYPPQYRKSTLTEAFAVELYGLIENFGADYWIYGHHHVNVPAFRIGKTELLTNQLGYVRLHEQRKFRRDAVINL